MKEEESKFKQLSEEELEQVNGGMITWNGIEVAIACAITNCPTGQHVDKNTCKCVPITNTIWR